MLDVHVLCLRWLLHDAINHDLKRWLSKRGALKGFWGRWEMDQAAQPTWVLAENWGTKKGKRAKKPRNLDPIRVLEGRYESVCENPSLLSS